MAVCAAIWDGVSVEAMVGEAVLEADGKLGSKKPCERCRGRWPGIQPVDRSPIGDCVRWRISASLIGRGGGGGGGGGREKFWRLVLLELAPSA